MKHIRFIKYLIISIAALNAAQGHATSLADALIQAYQTNPQLRIGQTSLRATDETVRQAKGAFHPTVSVNISLDDTNSSSAINPDTTHTESLITSIPIYAGNTRTSALKQARYNVLASRQALRGIEQDVLLNAVTAYMDVRRDRENVELAKNSVKVLTEEVRAARERFEVGEVTRTDVSQAESRLAASESALQSTRAALKRSIDFYIATIGSAPQNLRTPPPTPKLPTSANKAETIAIRKHPDILEQQFLVKSAEMDVETAKGNKRPRVSATVSASRTDNTLSGDLRNTTSIGLDFDQTLYQGGQLNSLERQARALLAQEEAELQLLGLQVRQNVQSAYATWFASKASIQARRKQVKAAEIAFEGTTEEAKLGSRTTLDALNAEQELLQARSDLLTAIRDEYVNAYTVLAAMGLLNVQHLNLGIESYNPDVHYSTVNGSKQLGKKRLDLLNKIEKRRGN